MAPDLPNSCSTARILRSTPSRRARSDSERTVTSIGGKMAQSPASIRKIDDHEEGSGEPVFKVARNETSSPANSRQRSDIPIQAKIVRVGSTRTSLGVTENAIAKTLLKSAKRKECIQDSETLPSKKSRRANPGIRVVGGKVYDSENGITCHQCRQKTMEATAVCKEGNTKCQRGFCSKCLFNRYGEKVMEVVELAAWPCPHCRGICNCSYCRKKKGLQATGILAHVAKAQGFDSVAELLKTSPKAAQPPPSERILKQTSPNSAAGPGPTQKSPRAKASSPEALKHSQEAAPPHGPAQAGVRSKSSNKRKSSKPSPAPLPEGAILAPPLPALEPVTPPTKRLKAPGLGLTPPPPHGADAEPLQLPPEGSGREGTDGGVAAPHDGAATTEWGGVEKKGRKRKAKLATEELASLPAPPSCPLAVVHGVAVPPALVGDVVQLLQFVATFAPLLALPALSPTKLLQELLEAERLPRGDRSTLGQLQARLLCLLLEERGAARPSTPWVAALHAYLTAHPLLPLLLHPRRPEAGQPTPGRGPAAAQGQAGTGKRLDSLDEAARQGAGRRDAVRMVEALADRTAAAGYTLLSPADRVFLLKLLFDDAVETEGFRRHLEAALAAAEEATRQQRWEAAAAREEVKQARAKLRELEVAQLVGLPGERSPLSGEAEQQRGAALREQAAQLSTAVHAAKLAAEKCPDAVDCPTMRHLPLGAAQRGVHFWKLAAAQDSLLSQDLTGNDESWLQSSPSKIDAFLVALKASTGPGKHLEAKLRAAFPKQGEQEV